MNIDLESDFVNKFKLHDLRLFNVDHWLVSLRPKQPTIGSLVLTLNRPCKRLSMITPEEGQSLAKAYNAIESLLKVSFNPQKVNYLALMMFDEQVHFHVLPRYENPVRFNRVDFEDAGWPGPPLLDALNLNSAQLKSLHNYLLEKTSDKKNLN